jgi:hypothetical protein
MNIEKAIDNLDDQHPTENDAAEEEAQSEVVDSYPEQTEPESESETDSSEVDEQAADQQMAGITGEEFQGALSSVGEAVRQVGESADWATEKLFRKDIDNAGQMG